MITDFFKYVSDLRDFAPQMPTDSRIEAMEAHFRPQYQKIVNLIGQETYDMLKEHYAGNACDISTEKGKAVWYLRGALANLTAIPYFIFEASQRNNTDNKLYRYQEQQQTEVYLENAWTELNFLLDHMEASIDSFEKYKETGQYRLRDTLFIKNAREFNRYYGAVSSSYFFNNVVFIIEEVQREEIHNRLKGFPSVSDNLKWLAGKAIAYETLARACVQLDYTELPSGIRADIHKDTETRMGKNLRSETDTKNNVAAFFANKARAYMLQIEEENNANRNEGSHVIYDRDLTANDKFYLP